MKKIILITTVLVIGLIILVAGEAAKDALELKKKTEAEYVECLKTESKYVCEAYRNSVYARRSSNSAATSAAVSSGMSGAAMGMSAGRR